MSYFLNLFDLEMLFLAEHVTESAFSINVLWEMLPYIDRLTSSIHSPLSQKLFHLLRAFSWGEEEAKLTLLIGIKLMIRESCCMGKRVKNKIRSLIKGKFDCLFLVSTFLASCAGPCR